MNTEIDMSDSDTDTDMSESDYTDVETDDDDSNVEMTLDQALIRLFQACADYELYRAEMNAELIQLQTEINNRLMSARQ